MKKLIILLLSFCAAAIQFSCTDDTKFPNPLVNELENGGFIRFVQGSQPVPGAYSLLDLDAIGFSLPIEDPNNNAISYSLTLTAVVSGNEFIADFVEITSFPNVLTVNIQNIADALGLAPTDFNFGDTFSFIAKVTRDDGTLFYGLTPSFNDTDLTTEIGNTNGTLLSSPSYRNAMNFSFALACPAFVASDFVGTWNVDELGFGGFFGETQPTRDIIAGPDDNQITIVGGEYPTAGGEQDDLILTFDPLTGIVSAVNTDGVSFGPGNTQGLITNTYLLEEGLLLPCIDEINLILNFNPFSNNPHNFNLSR